MQISKIHFNSLNPSLSQKVFSRSAKINFQAQNQDTFTKTEDFGSIVLYNDEPVDKEIIIDLRDEETQELFTEKLQRETETHPRLHPRL